MERITAIRTALENAQVKRGTGAAIINTCARALRSNSGIVRERGWNAALSFATAKLLNMPECDNPQAIQFVRGFGPVPNMAYDQMVR
jgi:hypothetical protein